MTEFFSRLPDWFWFGLLGVTALAIVLGGSFRFEHSSKGGTRLGLWFNGLFKRDTSTPEASMPKDKPSLPPARSSGDNVETPAE